MSWANEFKTVRNPAEVTLEWSGDRDNGFFYFYDKEAKAKEQVRELTFVPLKERFGITGYSQGLKAGIYSNEVSSTQNQILTVKYSKDGKQHEICQGKYKDIKAKAHTEGGKFTTFVYAMILDCDKLETGSIVKLALSGAATSPWIDLKNKDISGCAVQVDGYEDKSNGGIRFRAPKFVAVQVEQEQVVDIEAAYQQVVSYFSNAPHTTTHEEDRVPDHVIDEGERYVPEEEHGFDDSVPF